MDPAPGIDRPAAAHRVGIHVAVEHQAPAAAGSLRHPDGIPAFGLDRLEVGGEPERPHALDHEARQRAFARRAAVALEADHLGEEVERARGIDGIDQAPRIGHAGKLHQSTDIGTHGTSRAPTTRTAGRAPISIRQRWISSKSSYNVELRFPSGVFTLVIGLPP